MDDFNIQAIFSKVKSAVSDFFTPETIISKKPQQQSIYPLIQDLENKSKVGWTGQYWTPHESKEGGTDTIAYGHKLTNKEQQGNYVMINGEQVPFNKLTEQKAQQLFL